MTDEHEVQLEVLGIAHGPSYVCMIDECDGAGEGYPYNNVDLAREDFGQFVREADHEAAGIGLPAGMLLTVEGDNPAPVRVIEKNGGRHLRDTVDDDGEQVASYWIDLR